MSNEHGAKKEKKYEIRNYIFRRKCVLYVELPPYHGFAIVLEMLWNIHIPQLSFFGNWFSLLSYMWCTWFAD